MNKHCVQSAIPFLYPFSLLLAARRSVGGGVAALSFDEEFQRRRIRRRREAGGGALDRGSGARGAARIMGHAVRDLGGGIYHGVTGVVVEPYRRARVRAVATIHRRRFVFLLLYSRGRQKSDWPTVFVSSGCCSVRLGHVRSASTSALKHAFRESLRAGA